MNPTSIASKIRNQSITESVLKNIHFRKGVSISPDHIKKYYATELLNIGGINFADAVKNSSPFIDTTMDSRKASKVAEALQLVDFTVEDVIEGIIRDNGLRQELVEVFKTPGNEFEFFNNSDPPKAWLQELMESESVDAVFLDSGEFSSMPEWDIVEKSLRPGGYVILHDIFFPKSFKNWLVCGSIKANPNYEIIYIDRSLPQGLMIAQKII